MARGASSWRQCCGWFRHALICGDGFRGRHIDVCAHRSRSTNSGCRRKVAAGGHQRTHRSISPRVALYARTRSEMAAETCGYRPVDRRSRLDFDKAGHVPTSVSMEAQGNPTQLIPTSNWSTQRRGPDGRRTLLPAPLPRSHCLGSPGMERGEKRPASLAVHPQDHLPAPEEKRRPDERSFRPRR